MSKLFSEQPVKLPQGEKLKRLTNIDLMELDMQLKNKKFTGYLILDIPDHALKPGGEGKLLFIDGDIIAASFEVKDQVLVRHAAIEEMFGFHYVIADIVSYDETDIWLAIEMNRSNLFHYEPPEIKEVVKPTTVEFKQQPTKKVGEAAQEAEESWFRIVTFKKKEKRLTREELLDKYKLKETTDAEAEVLIKGATNKEEATGS
jgi:hypothetical protein